MRMLLSDDGTGGMLPLVTTQSHAGRDVGRARGSRAVIRDGWPQRRRADAELLAETLVRLAISYVTVPKGSPHATAARRRRAARPVHRARADGGA